MIVLLLGLGAMNFAGKAVLCLEAMPIIEELHVSPAHWLSLLAVCPLTGAGE
jgi:hypothetical protein